MPDDPLEVFRFLSRRYWFALKYNRVEVYIICFVITTVAYWLGVSVNG